MQQRNLTRKLAFACLLAQAAIFVLAKSSHAAETKPNVIVVITDDQGYGDLSCHGNPLLKTPELDRMAADSVRLQNYHVSPTCSPTRSALLTGHWTNRTGVWHTIMGRSMLRENEVTVGELFSDAGYETGMFGKWHLGDNHPCRPEDRGFSEVLRHGGGGVGQTPDYWDNAYFDGTYWHNGKPEAVEGFCTDVFFNGAMNFIRQCGREKKPFFAYLATNAPHGPMHCPEEFSAPYQSLPEGLANFYGMIANIDANFGRLRKMLAEEGLEENTILIFTTDNGSALGWRQFNAGMRAGKGSEYDGGHRVPFFIRWPAAGIEGGNVVQPLTAHVDVVPTLLDLCRIPQPSTVQFDGTSLADLLTNPSAAESWPDRILVTDSQRVRDPIKWRKSSVMTTQWRLINGKELYDILSDPGQQTDVASGHPDVVERLREFYEAWWTELEPTFAQDVRISLGHPADNPGRLTSHDWITTGTTPWNQGHIRAAMKGKANTGFWNVRIHESGRYRFSLRRWPPEANMPIGQAVAPGAAVPGQKAYRETPGKSLPLVRAVLTIGEQSVEAVVDPTKPKVTFELDLSAGPSRLTTEFFTEDGTRYGAYYVDVERI